MEEETRKLVTLKTIDKITPIEGADRIETAHIGGWMVVVGKGEFYEGQQVFYFEPDSLLPVNRTYFINLKPRGVKLIDGNEYHRLRTVKLRGQISQGLVLPFSVMNEIESNPDIQLDILNKIEENGGNYSKLFGVIKWEDPILAKLGGKMKHFPEFIQKTDEERIQNLPKLVKQIVQDGTISDWYATEKIDGTSCTIWARITDEGILESGVCSRNYGLEEEEDNTYWKIAKTPMIYYEFAASNDDKLATPLEYVRMKCLEEARSMGGSNTPIYALQGEVYGEGIQKNPLRVKGQHFRIFNLIHNGERVTRTEIQSSYTELLKNWVPVFEQLTLPTTMEEIVSQPDGIYSLVPEADKNRQIEGIVWRNYNLNEIKVEKRKNLDEIDWSKIPEDKWDLVRKSVDEPIVASFKAISNEYLAKQKD